MVTRIIIMLLMLAASARANWFEVWARGMPQAGGAAYTPTAASNLIFRWDFNSGDGSSVPDTTGNGNNAVQSTGSKQPTIANGYGSFDGGDMLSTVATNLGNGLTNFTACFWINFTSFQTYVFPFGVYPASSPAGYYSGLEFDTTATKKMYGIMGNNAGASIGALSSSGLSTGVWTFCCVTRIAGGYTKLWIGLTSYTSVTASENPIPITSPWSIGGSLVSGATYVTGLFDEARLYNRRLTDSEVTNVFNEGRP